MGGGLILLPPARRLRGEGNIGPLRRSKLAGKRGAERRDGRLKEKSWMREGGRKGSSRKRKSDVNSHIKKLQDKNREILKDDTGAGLS